MNLENHAVQEISLDNDDIDVIDKFGNTIAVIQESNKPLDTVATDQSKSKKSFLDIVMSICPGIIEALREPNINHPEYWGTNTESEEGGP